MKKLLAMTLILALSHAALATRIISQPEDAYELVYAQVVLPGSAPGIVAFRDCERCATALSLTNSTQYFIDNQPAAYADFKRAADERQARRAENSTVYVTVFYDVAGRSVNRMVLSGR